MGRRAAAHQARRARLCRAKADQRQDGHAGAKQKQCLHVHGTTSAHLHLSEKIPPEPSGILAKALFLCSKSRGEEYADEAKGRGSRVTSHARATEKPRPNWTWSRRMWSMASFHVIAGASDTLEHIHV